MPLGIKIKKNQMQEILSCGGLTLTQNDEQIKIVATNVYSFMIRMVLYPLWLILWFAFWVNLIAILTDKNFKDLAIVLCILFPMALLVHCVLRNKRVFVFDEKGVRFYWVISHCSIPWRFIPLQGILAFDESHYGKTYHPATICSCITLYADRCISHFALTTDRDFISTTSQRLMLRLSQLRQKFEIESEIPPDFVVTKSVHFRLNTPPT